MTLQHIIVENYFRGTHPYSGMCHCQGYGYYPGGGTRPVLVCILSRWGFETPILFRTKNPKMPTLRLLAYWQYNSKSRTCQNGVEMAVEAKCQQESQLNTNTRWVMVFTVTSSDCKVKKARFYEFFFTLGWRLIGNKSLYKFPAPKHDSFRKYSSLNFRVFTVRDTKIGMLSPWKKSLRLIFSSLTISSIRRYVYAQVC